MKYFVVFFVCVSFFFTLNTTQSKAGYWDCEITFCRKKEKFWTDGYRYIHCKSATVEVQGEGRNNAQNNALSVHFTTKNRSG